MTLTARFIDVGQLDQARAAGRESLDSFRRAARMPDADLADIVKQLPVLAKFFSFLTRPEEALATSQLAVDVCVLIAPPPLAPAPLQRLTGLRQNLMARLTEAGVSAAATEVATESLASIEISAASWWRTVLGHAADLTDLSRRLAAGAAPEIAAAVLNAARSLAEDRPKAPAPPLPVGLSAEAGPAMTAGLASKADIAMTIEESTALAEFMTALALTDAAAAAHTLTVGLVPTRFCANPDPAEPTTHALAYGAPNRLWPPGRLVVAIDASGCVPLAMTPAGVPLPAGRTAVEDAIKRAFTTWAGVVAGPAGPVFSFAFVPPGSDNDIGVTFSAAPDGKLGVNGRIAETAGDGRHIWFDPQPGWDLVAVFDTALHEVGHVLGLSHSTSPGSVMYPYGPRNALVDPGSVEALTFEYALEGQLHLPERACTGRPALATTRILSFGGSSTHLHMVWRGPRDDEGIWVLDVRPGAAPAVDAPGALPVRLHREPRPGRSRRGQRVQPADGLEGPRRGPEPVLDPLAARR